MTPDAFLVRIVDPTLRLLSTWPGIAIPMTDQARVLVLAIAGQESGWQHRRQIGGPARGYWQFERGGGVAEVFERMPRQLSAVCASLDITFTVADVFEAICWNDELACAMARFLLWPYPGALPAVGDVDGAYLYYNRVWRPGVTRTETWPARYETAMKEVNASR